MASLPRCIGVLFLVFLVASAGGAGDGCNPEVQEQERFTDAKGYVTGGVVLAMELAVGFFWWHRFFGMVITEGSNVTENAPLAIVLHIFIQWLPFVLLLVGLVGCQEGLPWPAHWVYAFVMVLASPMLGAAPMFAPKVVVPFLGSSNTTASSVYVYALTIFYNADIWTDNMTAAIAFACGWDKAAFLVWTTVQSILLRVLVSVMMLGGLGALWACFGALPDTFEKVDEGENGRKYVGTMLLISFLTNSLPQAVLQFWFAYETSAHFANMDTPSPLVYVSLSLNALMGMKTFVKGCRALWGTDYAKVVDEHSGTVRALTA